MNQRSFELESPEAVLLRFPIAEMPARVFAFGLDILLIALFGILTLILAAMVSGLSGISEPIAMWIVLGFLVRQFYFVFFEIVWHGTTPGKRIMRLRVIAREGSGLSVDGVITRNLMRDLELFVPLTVAAAPSQIFGEVPLYIRIPAVLWVLILTLLPFMTRDRLRPGDIAGGTIVVRVPVAELIADEAARSSLAPTHPASSAIELTPAQLSVYGERELEVLADLMRKIDDGKASLEDQAHIARTIARKIRYEGPEPMREPTRFLQTFYRVQRAALEKQLLFGKRKASKEDR
jgi:uncharacterized RDD family membrane protein YckC